MDDDAGTGAYLPVPVSAYGPLDALAEQVHDLTQTSRAREALAALAVYEPLARAFGDEKTVGFLLQSRMFAYVNLGRLQEALTAGERLLSHHESAGSVVGVAKTLADLARVHLYVDQLSEAMQCLARAGLLLERTGVRNERYVAALGSLMGTAINAELYETSRAAYHQILQLRTATDRTESFAIYDLIHAEMLLEWGLRLDQLGDHTAARVRLRTAAELFARSCDIPAGGDATDKALSLSASYAVALAKLGEVDRTLDLAAGIVVPLRAAGDWYHARQAHLALGIALRVNGDLPAARRELLAAKQLGPDSSAGGGLVVGFELAVLAAQEIGEHATRDLRSMIHDQARQLWRQRLQRVAMLRQARQREEQEQARQRAEAALLFDPLTGLANRRRFDQIMADLDTGEINEPTALLLLDVDKFKTINDTYSHSVGDQVLREIAVILQANCRAGDIPIRYAGDEFVIFLHADLTGARRIAERIRATVRGANLHHIAAGLRISISIGATALRPGMTAQDLFNAADANLYHAKRGGRDQVAA
ncbi:diguanylate cyclase [Planosporangium sp. 12N6]|uniref:GGDEF domain-containing protein n=1 Tax=Planosporangium spinosum TaxID=3402278 RepID=UPI003CFB3086